MALDFDQDGEIDSDDLRQVFGDCVSLIDDERWAKITNKVDADGDGTISFTEYFFFLVLLQSNTRDLRKVFKKYEDKETHQVTREQCTLVLRDLRKSTQAGARQMDRV